MPQEHVLLSPRSCSVGRRQTASPLASVELVKTRLLVWIDSELYFASGRLLSGIEWSPRSSCKYVVTAASFVCYVPIPPKNLKPPPPPSRAGRNTLRKRLVPQQSRFVREVRRGLGAVTRADERSAESRGVS